jgi:hypothetical protein
MRTLAFLLLLACSLPAFAQRPFIEDFTISGDTYLTDEDCFRLTEAYDYRSGSIWYKRPVSLREPFAVELRILVGCQDEVGADGMVFVFSSQPNRIGYVGEGIGFSGLRPSVGIEIDTWLNYHLNDPAEDHLAIMFNGRVGHYKGQAEPAVIPNIEDCMLHSFVVLWRPDIQKLSVELDGQEVVSAQADLLNGVFGGNDEVYWGMTAATGRYNNIHEVCFDRIGYQDPDLPYPMRVPETYYARLEAKP